MMPCARFALLLLAVALPLAAQMKLTVGQLAQFITSSRQLKHDDRKVADYLKKVQLTERLDDERLEAMIGQGVGPATLKALTTLKDASKNLPKAAAEPQRPAPVPIPSPPSAVQKQVIGEVREVALSYTKNLPDFICLQVTRRYADPSGLEFFRQLDTLVARLSFFGQKEEYKLVSVDGAPSEKSYHELGGATSSGEFGSMLREIFEPSTHADFWWERWATLRGRRVHVYGYRVSQANSKWSIVWEKSLNITPGYRGFLYVDRDAPVIYRVTLEAENIPASFPIQEARTTLDYDNTDIAGKAFLLPLRAEVRMRENRLLVRNQTEFRNYRKFGAETVITFDAPEALPEDTFKEKPPAQNRERQ